LARVLLCTFSRVTDCKKKRLRRAQKTILFYRWNWQPLLANIDNAFTCHTENRKTKREAKYTEITVQADGIMGV
jgi:hypothetical protein